MRIRIAGKEYQATLRPKGNTIIDGMRVAYNGNIHDFVEDITEYDAEGVEVIYYPIAIVEP